MLDILRQTPAYQRWISQASASQHDELMNYRYHAARVDQALILLDLLWPEFLEIDGLVLRRDAVPENWSEFKREAQEAKWSKSDIEYVVNHVHLHDFFMNDPDRDEVPNAVYVLLARVIAEAWQCKLEKVYPDESFVVGVAQEDTEPEVYAYTVRESEDG